MGPDLLRCESFGSVLYRRADASFEVYPPAMTSLLLAARHDNIMACWQRAAPNPNVHGLDFTTFVVDVASLRERGVLDEDYRLTADVVVPPQLPAQGLAAPLVTNIQLTRACNLHCDHCFVDVEARPHPDELSLAQLTTAFRDLRAAGAPLVLLAGGEPLMRPDIVDVVAAAVDADLDVALCTNATMITPAKASWLASSGIRWFSISLDGPTAEVHDRLRGARAFERATRGIEALVAAGAAGIKLRVTVTAHNAHTLAAFADTARRLGVDDVVFKPFRHTTGGEALTAEALYLSRRDYEAAVQATREAWPAHGPSATFDDGLPESLPAWTKVTPAFGCVGGTTHASVIYDGRVVACDAVHDPRDWTLHTHRLLAAWLNAPTIVGWRHLDNDGSCSSCASFAGCGGGCRARAMAAGNTIHGPDPWSHCEPRRAHPFRRGLRVVQ